MSAERGRWARSVASAIAVGGMALGLATGCEAGDSVVLGVSLRSELVDAARMAVEDELVRSPIPALETEMIPEDVTSSVSAIRAAERFAGTPDVVSVVGHTTSAASIMAASIYNERRIVQMAPISTARVYSELGAHSFRMVPPDARQARFLAELLTRAFPDGARVAMLYMNSDYGRGLRSELLMELDRGRFTVALDLPHTEDAVEPATFEHAVGAVDAARPDVILWLGRGAGLDAFLSGFRPVGGDVPVIGSDAVASAVPVEGMREDWGPVQYVDFVDMEGTEALRDFVQRYRDRFGRDAAGPEALTYDAVRLLLSGIRAGARSGDDLRRYLESLGRERPPFQGITGPVSFDEQGDAERSYVVVEAGSGSEE